MKKYPKIVQCDARGQIVIPKDIRQELEIEEGSAFWMYSITEEGILLKLVPKDELSEHSVVISRIKEKSDKIGVSSKNVDKSVSEYKKRPSGRMEEI
ncbi:AbrB/MazE/SpoVT family DNA-binding domain-containing protein [Candidatus Woesearchaeota archaeon]|nr:AbrB/MazE/SpoVT family DNA-binding domain-containing protein [Candidatus Woesearchaeota archaeon]